MGFFASYLSKPAGAVVKRRILLVDDELVVLFTLKTILEIYGFEAETAASAKEAIAKLRRNRYHLVITDMRMENEHSGYDVIHAAKERDYDPAVAILTAYPLGGSWNAVGVQSVLVKPAEDLIRQIEILLVQREERSKIGPRKTVQASSRPLAEKKAKEIFLG